MSGKPRFQRIIYFFRNLRSRPLFRAIRKHCRGDVLDVGGWDFFLKGENVSFHSWTIVELDKDRLPAPTHERIRAINGDGTNLCFLNESFDLVLNINVLEHVYDPARMVQETCRVLKKSAIAIFLVPQTGNLHYIPKHYCNFTRFWIEEVMQRSGLEILELKPLGGTWSTIATKLFFFLLQSAGLRNVAYGGRRNFFFYLLYPLMLLFVLVSIPVCLLLSLGDLVEEAHNHLVVVRKTSSGASAA